MSHRSDVARRSYAKTTWACLGLALLITSTALLSLHALPKQLALGAVLIAGLAGLLAAIFFCAGLLVLARHKRSLMNRTDFFLELNRSREPEAIAARVAGRASRFRRWVVRRVLGHDLVVGDLVEVKQWSEIVATLDGRGCLDGLPFMPEMLAMCGRRARVFRCMHRLFDYRKTRRMRHMDRAVLLIGTVCDGSSHGGCEAGCHTIWKSAWLRRVEPVDEGDATPLNDNDTREVNDVAVLKHGARGPDYACQLTQLHAASRPTAAWSVINFLRPLVSGNVAPAAFIVGWLTYLFNELQTRRGGVEFPAFEDTRHPSRGPDVPAFAAGDRAVVKSSAEIRATLTDRLSHRGLWFEPDMLKHCGRRCIVRAEVRKLIDIVSGEIRTLKTPAYALRDVHFSGERQLFNSQYEPLFWRAAWLRRDVEHEAGADRGNGRVD